MTTSDEHCFPAFDRFGLHLCCFAAARAAATSESASPFLPAKECAYTHGHAVAHAYPWAPTQVITTHTIQARRVNTSHTHTHPWWVTHMCHSSLMRCRFKLCLSMNHTHQDTVSGVHYCDSVSSLRPFRNLKSAPRFCFMQAWICHQNGAPPDRPPTPSGRVSKRQRQKQPHL